MEVSNNTLIVLVIMAMAVSVGGTMTMISLVPGGPSVFSGMDTLTDSGTALVEVAEETAIILIVDTVDFGVIAGVEGTQNDTTDYITGSGPHPFVLRNNGTVVINVSIAESTGDTLWEKDSECEWCFQFNSTPNGTSGAVAYYDWKNFDEANWAENATAGEVYADVANLVYNLSTAKGGNERDVNVHLNISVPDGEDAGQKSGAIFFKAYASAS